MANLKPDTYLRQELTISQTANVAGPALMALTMMAPQQQPLGALKRQGLLLTSPGANTAHPGTQAHSKGKDLGFCLYWGREWGA